ncbi:MAG TPA: DUF4290 domain-containing protein [Microscillaceae bacterium]|jgi:hypothetical protein|nr:DUF4290 domain-containing protein [Microscillaceae bacterium]
MDIEQNFSYNTHRSHLILKEYGRNIHQLIEYIKTIDDKEKRTRYAHTLTELMRLIVPQPKEVQLIDNQNKLWDDMFIMAKFDFDVESPFPLPDKEKLGKKPEKLPYNSNRIMFRHYGRNVETLIGKALVMEDEEEKIGAFVAIGKLMRGFYLAWNKDYVEAQTILADMERIAHQPLPEHIRKIVLENNTIEIPKEKFVSRSNNQNNHNNHHAQNHNQHQFSKKKKKKKKNNHHNNQG